MVVWRKSTASWAALFAVLLISGASAEAPEIMSSGDGGIVVRYETGELTLSSLPLVGRNYTQVLLEGADLMGLPGAPNLPVARLTLAVPECEAVGLSVTTRGTSVTPGLRVIPALSMVPTEEGEISSYEYIEGDLYSHEGYWPERAAAVSEPKRLWDQHIVNLEFYPCQVDPSTGALVSHDAIEVTLSFSGVRDRTSPRQQLSPRHENLMRAVLANYDSGLSWRSGKSERAATVRADYFDTSNNWLKLGVDTAGMYTVGHGDLVAAGVDPSAIDPSSIRVFTGTGFDLDPGLAAPVADWMDECEILVTGEADGNFDQGDRVVFFGLGVDGWSDGMYPSPPADEPYTEHSFGGTNFYWMTWESGSTPFEGTPLRMASDDLQDSADPLSVSDYVDRQHFEDNKFPIENKSDGYYMRQMSRTYFPEWATFYGRLFNVVTDSTGVLRGRFDGNSSSIALNDHYAIFSLNGEEIAVGEWDAYETFLLEVEGVTYRDYLPGVAGEDENVFVVHVPRADQEHEEDQILIDWFDFEYWRTLWADRDPEDGIDDDLIAFGSSNRTGTLEYTVAGFVTDDVSVFKVIDRHVVRTVPGVTVAPSGARYDAVFQDYVADTASYFAVTSGGYLTPSIERRTPGILRSDTGVDYVMIVYDEFEEELLRLANFRISGEGGGFDVRVATVSEVYDEFSWGVPDPAAIRNYLRYLYESSGDPATHVLLVGDTSYDHRSYLDSGLTAYVPSFYMYYQGVLWPSDAWFTGFDDDTQFNPAMAIGRLPVESGEQLSTMIDKILHYEQESEPGLWKNRAVLTADDEYNKDHPTAIELSHTSQAEQIAREVLPWPIDRKKIYLMEYDLVGEEKPAARVDFIEAWNEGALLINYTGHGNEELMAHEHVFLLDDIYSLKNIDALPLFFAASCRLNRIDMPDDDSVGELLALSAAGGTVASIGSTRNSFADQNSALNRAFLSACFGGQQEATTSVMDIGQALQAAYIVTNSGSLWDNNAKFVLVGDPAVTLASPEGSGVLGPEDLAPIARRSTVSMEGENGGATAGEDGVALIRVEDTADVSGYTQPETGFHLDYRLPGEVMFEGSATVSGGLFSAEFVVPTLAEEGPNGRIRAYFYGSDMDGSMSFEDVAIADSVDVSDGIGPAITLEFEGGSTSVLPGSELSVSLSDASGINMVNRDPEDAITLWDDVHQEYRDVTDDFSYDLGSHTEGGFYIDVSSLDMDMGSHSVRVAASDNVGNRSEESVSFTIVPSMGFEILNVANHPNPFPEGASPGTTIMFQLPESAGVSIDIFTVGGRLIKRIDSIAATAGANEIYWDGRDAEGEELANGVYLFRILAVSDEYQGDKAEAIGRAVIMR